MSGLFTKDMSIRAIICLSFFLAPLAFGAGQIRRDAVQVLLSDLISSPERYAGKPVRVIGYLHMEFEGRAVYLHKEDFEKKLYRNGLWVGGSPEMMKEMMKMNDRYIVIEGVFSPDMRGHMGLWSGSISQINHAIISAPDPVKGK